MAVNTSGAGLDVGAGPSGMAYALGALVASEAAGRPLKLQVLEAADRPGGWVHTRRVGPYALETGPYGYLDKHPELGRIVDLVRARSTVFPGDGDGNQVW